MDNQDPTNTQIVEALGLAQVGSIPILVSVTMSSISCKPGSTKTKKN